MADRNPRQRAAGSPPRRPARPGATPPCSSRRAGRWPRTARSSPIRSASGSDALTLADRRAHSWRTRAGRTEPFSLAVDAADAFGRHFPRAGGRSLERLFIVVPEADQAPRGRSRMARRGGSVLPGRRPPTGPTFAAAAMASPRGTGEFSDGRGRRVIAAFRRIPELGWAVVVEVEGAGPSPRGAARLSGSCSEPGRSGRPRSGSAWRGTGHPGFVTTATWPTGTPATARCSTRRRRRWPLSVDGKVTYANPACVSMFALRSRWSAFPIGDFFAPGSREQVNEIVRDRLAGRPGARAVRGGRASGRRHDVRRRAAGHAPSTSRAARRTRRSCATSRCASAWRHGLRESEERYRLLFERSLSGVYRSTVERPPPRVQSRLRADDGIRVSGRGHGPAGRRVSRELRRRGEDFLAQPAPRRKPRGRTRTRAAARTAARSGSSRTSRSSGPRRTETKRSSERSST